MTFNSGDMRPLPPEVSRVWIITDAYAEPVVISDAEVLADNAEIDDGDDNGQR